MARINSLKLFEQAKAAGLIVRLDGEKLVIKGPKSRAHLAKELIENKAEILALVKAQNKLSVQNREVCPLCQGELRIRECSTRWEFECKHDPSHYCEHRRKPGSKGLWEDVPPSVEDTRQRFEVKHE